MMVDIRISSYGIHYYNECPHRDRDTNVCVCVLKMNPPEKHSTLLGLLSLLSHPHLKSALSARASKCPEKQT